MEKKTITGNLWLSPGEFRPGAIELAGGVIRGVRETAQTPDPRDAYILPGFVDAHFHLTSLAHKQLRCDLSGVRSADEIEAELARYARETDQPSVVGVEWDESRWKDHRPLTRTMLDRVDDRRPVLARRICGHIGVVNTVLLGRLSAHAGLINADTGVVLEHALWEAGRLCRPDDRLLEGAFDGAIRDLHALGVTTIHDIVTADKVESYARAMDRAKAPLRVDVLVHGSAAEIDRYRLAFGRGGRGDVRFAGLKCFLDGSVGGWTAALTEPYEDRDTTGSLLVPDAELRALARSCVEHGVVCAMHAIGDRAVDQALAAAREIAGLQEFGRIEHCELVTEAQLVGLVETGIAVCAQPNFARNWGGREGLYERRLGPHRARRMNPFRTLGDAGVRFFFGSDGMPPGPIYGLKAAVCHPVTGESIEPVDAIYRYLAGSRTVPRQSRVTGELRAGFLADLVVLDRNPLDGDLDTVEVLQTYVGGEVVYSTPGASPRGAPHRFDNGS